MKLDFEYQGERLSGREIARRVGLPYVTVLRRLKRGEAPDQRKAPVYTYQGVTDTLAGWARRKGINQRTLFARMNRKCWTIERALETPLDARGRRNEPAKPAKPKPAKPKLIRGPKNWYDYD